MARLVASSDCSDDDKEVAILWLSELTSDLVTKLNEYGVGQDESTHSDSAPWETPSRLASCGLRTQCMSMVHGFA